MARPPIPPREGISPVKVKLTGRVPEGPQYFAGSSGDSPFAAGEPLRPGTPLERPIMAWYYVDVPEEPFIPGTHQILEPAAATDTQRRDLLVVDKPCYVPVTPNGRILRNTLLTRLRLETGNDELTALHRLDRLTSGVVLFATRAECRGTYQTLFENRQIHKRYLAGVTQPELIPETWHRIELPLLKRPGSRTVEVAHGGRPTLTYLRRVGENTVELRPVTGFTHQLRVVLNHLGTPIIGDDTYPVDRNTCPFDATVPRLQLLAQALEFQLPDPPQPTATGAGNVASAAAGAVAGTVGGTVAEPGSAASQPGRFFVTSRQRLDVDPDLDYAAGTVGDPLSELPAARDFMGIG